MLREFGNTKAPGLEQNCSASNWSLGRLFHAFAVVTPFSTRGNGELRSYRLMRGERALRGRCCLGGRPVLII